MTRIRLLCVVAALALVGSLMPVAAQPPPDRGRAAAPPSHEVWALDQGEGLDRIHVYDPALAEVAVVDFEGWDVETPHMIDFDSAYRYAFVANTRSGNVAVVRTADYEVVDVVETGATAHMAAVTPDDSAIWVANIGARTFTEIVPDWDAETFTVGRELDVRDDPAWQAEFGDVEPTPAPVCHEYTADSRYAYLTLGPGAGSGGLVVVDITADEPFIDEAFSRDEVRANCGLALAHDGRHMFANWGDPGDPEDPPAQSGEWYVFDTRDHSLVKATDDTRGVDAHGVRINPRRPELWQVNRGTSNGIVVNTRTQEIVGEIPFTGDTPDILGFSPDGRRAYVSLRGPNPRSGAVHVATGSTPGFAVLDVARREVLEIVQPAAGTPDEEASDFHGIGVRVIRPRPGRG